MTTKPYTLNPKPLLNIGWLYPTLMSTYGDRGNIIVLKRIGENAGLNIVIRKLEIGRNSSDIASCDLLFMGGAQDLQQEIVNKDLLTNKGKVLQQMVEDGTPGLYICGAYQFLGKYYKDAYGTKIPGLGIFDMYTESFETKPRLVGNIVVKPQNVILGSHATPESDPGHPPAGEAGARMTDLLVGFENHGGRTYLNDKTQAFAKVITGFGNNGEDKTEGIAYKNSIGTYLHGPILPSNPKLGVYLLQIAYKKKYGEELNIKFDDELSKKAKIVMLKRLKTSY